MTEIQYKYNKTIAQVWLLKVALLLSIFVFSGFNENIEYSFQESVKIELVESKDYHSDLGLKKFKKGFSKIPSTVSYFEIKKNSFLVAQLNFNQTVTTQYKNALTKTLVFSSSSIRLPIKNIFSSSEDDILHTSM